jgi:murein DD-endopeptidase MepM/ murein hydrolase activator NlpD
MPTTNLGSGWFSPVLNGTSGQYYVRCGSTFHTGSAAYADDVNAPKNKPVYSARGGSKILATWGNTGYGNHIPVLAIVVGWDVNTGKNQL